MRIIAGEYKGRKLLTPRDRQIRPTTDKVKEAVFSMVQPVLSGAIVVDLFAGTGNLGLEALSRGAARCYFCDHARESLGLLRENISHFGAEDRARILAGDYEKTLEQIPEPADVIFLDPPYKRGLLLSCIERIATKSLLRENGLLVCECGKQEELPEWIGSLGKIKDKTYGSIRIAIYG